MSIIKNQTDTNTRYYYNYFKPIELIALDFVSLTRTCFAFHFCVCVCVVSLSCCCLDIRWIGNQGWAKRLDNIPKAHNNPNMPYQTQTFQWHCSLSLSLLCCVCWDVRMPREEGLPRRVQNRNLFYFQKQWPYNWCYLPSIKTKRQAVPAYFQKWIVPLSLLVHSHLPLFTPKPYPTLPYSSPILFYYIILISLFCSSIMHYSF